MKTSEDYQTTFTVSQSTQEAFQAINQPRNWWSEQIEGTTDELNATFDYHYKDVHRCKIKIVEFVPQQKVVWLVQQNYFNFTKDSTEWTGTKISFEISNEGDHTRLTFKHHGLTAKDECFDICSDSWGNYINGSLKQLIETGKGQPNPYIPSVKNAADLKEKNN